MNITLLPQSPASIVSINCGTSSPKLGGSVDITTLPNLITFTCALNDIVAFTGLNSCPNIKFLTLNNNKISGYFSSVFPNLNLNPALERFYCSNNVLSGSIPDLSYNTALTRFRCNGNSGISGAIPSLNANTVLEEFKSDACNLSGFTLSPVPPTLDIFIAANNVFTLTATWYCLSAFNQMITTYNITNGVIDLSGPNMPQLQTAAAGPINGEIYTIVNRLINPATYNWTIYLGNSSIPG